MSFRIVIPSATAGNLITCVESIIVRDPSVPASAIIVVDDGARSDVEIVFPQLTWVTGEKPFIFARNVNLGIVAAGNADVIVLNDDARLVTPNGFTLLSDQMRDHQDVGVCSAGIRGVVSNGHQLTRQQSSFRHESQRLAFVCVYITRPVINRVGLLDERFIGYGYEDYDYCRRVQMAGLGLAIWDGCVVDHSVSPSTYRSHHNWPDMEKLNHGLYCEKWADATVVQLHP
jgi:GT2 family glycosyltransferase